MNKTHISTNRTRNNHRRVNRIQRVPRFLPCKHETPEQMGKMTKEDSYYRDYRSGHRKSMI